MYPIPPRGEVTVPRRGRSKWVIETLEEGGWESRGLDVVLGSDRTQGFGTRVDGGPPECPWGTTSTRPCTSRIGIFRDPGGVGERGTDQSASRTRSPLRLPTAPSIYGESWWTILTSGGWVEPFWDREREGKTSMTRARRRSVGRRLSDESRSLCLDPGPPEW